MRSWASVLPCLVTSWAGLVWGDNSGIIFLTGTKPGLPVPSITEQVPTSTDATTTQWATSEPQDTRSSSTTWTSSSSWADTSSLVNASTVTASSLIAGNASTTTEPVPVATNTRACNNYVEFCQRRYSNISVVGAHNSPFVRAKSAAANQQFGVTAQLNDGVRFLQAQIQWPTNDTAPHFCHTSCDILDAGPITDWLKEVNSWVSTHPYDVVTILLGNGNYSSPSMYAPYIVQSGITQWAYTPPSPNVPMTLNDWPKLEEMILAGKRVVMFLDYQANQTAYPWLLDEFSYMWETPFDPLDSNFPCNIDRPPNLAAADGANRLYLMNHNFNVKVSLLGTEMSVPATPLLNQTNNVTGNGSLGLAAYTCLIEHGRAPNVLNVDYYNHGEIPGSVFRVAAMINNVTYNGTCCSTVTSDAEHGATMPMLVLSMVAMWSISWLIGIDL